MKDLYYLLGTDRNCTSSELNTAYQKLARKLQPGEKEHDHFLEDHLKEITEAYQTLSDPDKRRKYDAAYKKNYQRRLYYLKIKHLNIAATLALLLFTGLFGWYVIRMINGIKPKKVTTVVSDVRSPISTPKVAIHHKKKHIDKSTLVADPKLSIAKDTIVKKELKPVMVNDDKPVIEQGNQDKPGSVSYLQSNVTGMIYLHKSASYTSPIVSKVPNHSKVTILEKGDQFYKVTFNDQTGYVPSWTVVRK